MVCRDGSFSRHAADDLVDLLGRLSASRFELHAHDGVEPGAEELGVTDVIREHYMAVLSYEVDGYSPDEVRRMRYGMEFSIDGAVGVSRMWIQGGCVKGMDDVARLICTMMAAARNAAIARCAAGA